MAPTSIPGFSGTVIRPHEADYDAARAIWNAMHDRRPALIARPQSAPDVAAAIRYARAEGLLIAVRAAPMTPGQFVGDDGIMSLVESRSGDPEATAVVGGGTLLGEVDRATQQHGLVLLAGVVSHTGAGGLTLGGGVGRLMRRFGLTIDSLHPRRSSPPTARSCVRQRTSTPNCSGRCVAAAATSASSPSSSSRCTAVGAPYPGHLPPARRLAPGDRAGRPCLARSRARSCCGRASCSSPAFE